MILRISQRLGLAAIGERFFGAVAPVRVDGIEVTEFMEYQNPALIADARELLASSYAQTQSLVIETRAGER